MLCRLTALLFAAVFALPTGAEEAAVKGQAGVTDAILATTAAPVVSIIIDDLGDNLPLGKRALGLNGAITYAILPRTTYSTELAILAHNDGKEVMLHQPMEALNGKAMGPGGMGLYMSQEEMVTTLKANLASVPYARGINNHMGSLLTRHPGAMEWLMTALAHQGNYYFVDSLTASGSVARTLAAEHHLPNTRRNVFLDHDPRPDAIRKQFKRFIALARQHGSAVAIGHPYPETLATLPSLLSELGGQGIALVPVSQLIDLKSNRRSQRLWHASLSLSPKDSKSLKQ